MSWLRRLLEASCSRRHRPVDAEPGFWEAAPEPKAGDDAAEAEEESDPPGYEQAVHLKDEGNEKFSRGSPVNEAMDCWAHALDALCAPPEEEGASGVPPCAGSAGGPGPCDPRVQELRATLLLNLALGHKKLKQWRHAVGCCDEVLLEQPGNVKALYRKSDALGELCEWREAQDTATKLEETGEEGKKLALQKKEEWRRRRKAADGKQKKMWSAALSETKARGGTADPGTKGAPEVASTESLAQWAVPRVLPMSVFDLRRKGLEWAEDEDFDDAIWKDGLGQREATFYQRRALPLTLLAAAALGELELPAELIVHCLLDGNIAPFAESHDWSVVLSRCPTVRSLTIVYVDIGSVGADPTAAQLPMPYGTLLRPTEEGRVGDRVAHAARFLGTYKEFKEHCRELPGLVVPHLALWADVPLYGFSDDDLAVRLETLGMLSSSGVPSIFTHGAEVPARGGPPTAPHVGEHCSVSMAILQAGVGARMSPDWHWNRFVVPLDRGVHGILAAHAVVGIVTAASAREPAQVKKALAARGLCLAPYRIPGREEEPDALRKRQWEAFCKQMRDAGRPVGPAADEQERSRQSMEFYHFCGLSDPPP